MCGRYASGQGTWAEYRAWLDLAPAAAPSNMQPRYNIAPTQSALICRQEPERRVGVMARWGLVPRWWRKPLSEIKVSAFNARAEEARQKPFFRASLKDRRCLAPAIGYYEWTGPRTARTPWFIRARNEAAFCFAGLWDRADVPAQDGAAQIGETQLIDSFSILTVAANADTAHLHHRMPVILPADAWAAWLDPNTSADVVDALMRPGPEGELEAYQVDRAVGNVRNEGAHLIAAADLFGG